MEHEPVNWDKKSNDVREDESHFLLVLRKKKNKRLNSQFEFTPELVGFEPAP